MTYLIRLAPLKGVDGIKALRRLLKFALRACSLRCISAEEISDDEHTPSSSRSAL